MHRPVPRIIGTALVSALALVAGSCSTDTTGPDASSSIPVGGFARINGNRVHRASNGVVFTLDHSEGTLTATGGKRIRLRPDLFTRLEKDFDGMQAVETRTEHFKAQKDYQRVAQAQSMRHAAYRVHPSVASPPAGPSGAHSSGLQLGSGVSADLYDGMDLTGTSCLEIAQAIYAEQPKYEYAREQLDHALFDAAQAGSRDGGTWDWEDYLAALALEAADWNYQVELTTMNFLAVLYNSYNCWDNHWTDASVTSSGGGGGGSGGDGGGGSCYEAYGSVDISYDGGATWEELWSGWYSVCGEMAE
jgi:hypothetical protein